MCLKYLSGYSLETTAYSLAVISKMMSNTEGTGTYATVIDQLCSTDDIRAILPEIIDAGDPVSDIVIRHLDSTVNVVEFAVVIMDKLLESD
jgi:hypothetical protein